MKRQTAFSLAIAFFLSFCLSSCAGKAPASVSKLNSHVLHTQNGFMLLERKNYDLAKQEFDKATSLNKDYSLAYMGRAVVFLRQNMLTEAHDELQKALKSAKTDEEILKVKSGLIQFYSSPQFVTRHHEQNAWFVMAKEQFDDARKIRMNEEVYYYMAIAYERNFQFNDARNLLGEIAKTENPFTIPAREEQEHLNAVEEITAKYEKSKKIVFEENLTRGALSFILIDVFAIDKRLKAERGSVVLMAKDSMNTAYGESITKVINLNLNGLGMFQDKTFRPNKEVSRAELAALLQEISERLNGKSRVETKKKFTDVNPGDWFYENVVFAAGRGLMNEEDKLTMEFRPLEDVTTIEAFTALDMLLGKP